MPLLARCRFACAAVAVAPALACSSSPSGAGPTDSGSLPEVGADAAPPGDAAPSDAAGESSPPADGGLPFSCTPPPHPNPCPAPAGKSGEASFCYRPGWAGVTSVDVYVGKTGQASDWASPFTTLANDGTGTFTGTAALADGSYPYVFRVHGSADGLVRDGTWLRDPENPQFELPPTGAPPRSISVITVPQVATQTHEVRGLVTYAGAPQSCYSVDLEVGELLKDGGAVLSEHGTGAYTETAADGSFSFTVADGPIGVIVRYPFGLSSSYPDPTKTPSLGITRIGSEVAGADLMLPPAEIAYPLADYAAMSPAPGAMATLPVTFKFTVVPGATLAQASIASTDIAGNDPAWASGFATTTTATWNGVFGGMMGGNVKPGTTYYWGAWQEAMQKGGWVGQSLLFPIQFQ